MKTFATKLIYLSAAVLALTITSCQEEFEDVGGTPDQQNEAALTETTVDLISKTSSNDGSFDNIADGASCIAVQFPYTVDVAGIQLTIDSKEDLELIEEIFDEFDDDLDELDFIFPITVTLADYTEVVIENEAALRELAAQCQEGGSDDDIECIDFVYPITLFTFDVADQISNTFTINSDRELRLFFKEQRDSNDLVSIDYPVTLKKADGTEITVASNVELARALEQAEDACDEDDDNDYNDDDCETCSNERVKEALVSCGAWDILEFERNDADLISDYATATLFFNVEGGLLVVQNGMQFQGNYSISGEGNAILVTLNVPELPDFNLEWHLAEVDFDESYKEIDLIKGDGNVLELKSLCGEEEQGEDPDTLREILKECSWIIRKVELQDEEIDRLLGFEFEFLPDNVATLSNGITTGQGTWEVGYNEDQVLALLISFGDEPAVNFNWPLRELTNDRLKFEVEEIGYELILQRECNESAGDESVAEIRNFMLGGLWNVTLYEDEGENETEDYAGMDFGFSNFNQVEVSVNDDPIIAGVWRVLRDANGNVQLFLNLGDAEPFEDLTEAWFVGETTANSIELIYEDENINFKKLVFQRKM
ncbi:Hypothetical protein I595_2728 [Croceitalea dokdonensis DOKDO 023]|uniref:Lipocalin-like domain-containing protein n=1 Tax=Croceitalea dokdonensis DOKDO 023 TaxID=1300341 RepID=A0A0P7A4W4_9FLAO|nr:hypothetical protein [Croceitalea dokdonensis]KPM31461.1 Hypothetical protein I595_2728 [Croceitalea dokdonensis DOKDO 023]